MTIHDNQVRRGFTLIELLVVITLILVIAGMGVAFLPALGDTARQARGASLLQQWLLIAKQKALRDQVPCGLRLLPALTYLDPATSLPIANAQHLVHECQFIEQPDDFPSSAKSTIAVTAGSKEASCDVGLSDKVVPGDHLEILGGGLMHTIVGVKTGFPRTILLDVPFPYTLTTKQYRIVRAPRATGDDILQLPDPVMIDLATNSTYQNPLPSSTSPGAVDIVFAPSGAVISSGVTTDTINLWVRDYDAKKPNADIFDGNQSIVAIYVRSGLTAVHPPGGRSIVNGKLAPDPYKFIRDGRTSGQ